MKPIFRVLLPILLLAVGALTAVGIVKSKRDVPRQESKSLAPLVRVMTAERGDYEVLIPSQGTVIPRTESQVVAQVAGRITSVDPRFAAGGRFREGDLLLTIEAVDYEVSVVQARGQVAEAELILAQEKAEARVAEEEWAQLGQGEASLLNTRRLQVKRAEAALASAQASLRRAETNLGRTEVRAPFTGRVRSKSVDLGQYVLPGTPMGLIFSDDVAEIRLPILDRDLAFLEFDFDATGPSAESDVVFEAVFAGKKQSWNGRVVRVESAIDPETRMVHLIAAVADPYTVRPGHAPLSAGLFVQARITGSVLTDVTTLPREALRENDTVLVVVAGQLRTRTVRIVRLEGEVVVISDGLRSGDTICLSRLAVVSEGMEVRTAETGSLDKSGDPGGVAS